MERVVEAEVAALGNKKRPVVRAVVVVIVLVSAKDIALLFFTVFRTVDAIVSIMFENIFPCLIDRYDCEVVSVVVDDDDEKKPDVISLVGTSSLESNWLLQIFLFSW
jgi:hypothetical protein